MRPFAPASSGLRPDVAKSVFGPSMPAGALVFIGAVAGVIIGGDAQARGEPFLYFLGPAWFFQVAVRIWNLLRFPRAHAWPFILGLSFKQRRSLSRMLLGQKIIEFCPLALSAVAAFFICHSAVLHGVLWNKLTGGIFVFSLEAVFCSLALYCAVAWNLITPIKSDRSKRLFFASGLSIPAMTGLYKLSGFFVRRVLPSGAAELIQRQIIYLLRMDLFSLIVFPPLALTIAALLLFYVKDGFGFVGEAAALIAPFALMVDRTSVFDESSQKLISCPYYLASASDRLLSNVCFAALACFPFTALFLAARITAFNGNVFGFLIHAASFTAGILALVIVMAYRWLLPGWTSVSSSIAATTLLCALLGCAIPRVGIIFPLFSTVMVIVFLGDHSRNHLKV